MEHRLVLTVLAEEGDVVPEIHVLEVIGNKTAIAPLNAFAEFGDDVF